MILSTDEMAYPELQVQIVVVKRLGKGKFEEVSRTDPVYCANPESINHVDAVVAAIERYGKNL